ncbi:MAG: hypothetical protein COB50_03435 [Thiotrichales bacterium]|nr:MAG: hypothetical protein COB50_03435 [Thiotrichales bacterium]
MSDSRIEVVKNTKKRRKKFSPTQLMKLVVNADIEELNLDSSEENIVLDFTRLTDEDIATFFQGTINDAVSRRGTVDSHLHFNQGSWNDFLKDMQASSDKSYCLDKKDEYLPTIKKIAAFAKKYLPLEAKQKNYSQVSLLDKKHHSTKQQNSIFADSFYLQEAKKKDINQSHSISMYNNTSLSNKFELNELLINEKQEIEHKLTEKELQFKLSEQRALLLHHQITKFENLY